MRTLLVGLDAAAPDVLEQLFEAGKIPTLERLFSEGTRGPLESQIPPWTASAWPSMYTGTNPGKHGVFDFLRFEGYDWDLVNSSDVRRRTIWEYLDEHGYSSVIVNAPVTHPPRSFEGALIPGYLAPENPQCHPDGILDDVREDVGDYRVYARRETDERRDPDEKLADYVELTDLRGEAFIYLADRFDPDFGFIEFQKTDAVFHDFPGDFEKVADVYRAVDRQVEAILDECNPERVVVASDHGIGEYSGYEFRVNEYLRQQGRVKTSQQEDVPSWFEVKDRELTGTESRGSSVHWLTRVARTLGRVGITYQRGKRLLERVGLADTVGRFVPVSAVFAASEAVDFAASEAYLRSVSELGVRLNVEGRDPDGVIPAGDYEEVRARVMSELREATAPDGEPVFEDVLPSEAVFEGPCVSEGVDILTIPSEFDHSLSSQVGDLFDSPEPWNHKLTGVVAIWGGDIESGEITDAHLFDIAPTVLSIFDVPPNVSMDGETLAPVRGVEPIDYPAMELTERTVTQDEAVEERLADLGYLE